MAQRKEDKGVAEQANILTLSTDCARLFNSTVAVYPNCVEYGEEEVEKEASHFALSPAHKRIVDLPEPQRLDVLVLVPKDLPDL